MEPMAETSGNKDTDTVAREKMEKQEEEITRLRSEAMDERTEAEELSNGLERSKR